MKETTMKNKDIALAKTYWNNASKSTHDQMIKTIKTSAIVGRIWTFATLENKDKLSTYRVLASKMGYTMGTWLLRDNNLTATATIKKTI